MYAYRMETVIPQNGDLQIKSLPFRPGEAVEVIILVIDKAQEKLNNFPLKNTVLKYEDPTEPVVEPS